MKTDCFAFRNGGYETDCKILTSLVCRYGNRCSFYKTKEQRDAELRRIHGTADLREIGKQYAAGHVEKGENE